MTAEQLAPLLWLEYCRDFGEWYGPIAWSDVTYATRQRWIRVAGVALRCGAWAAEQRT